MSISPGLPPDPNNRDKNETLRVGLPHHQPGEMGLGERLDAPVEGPWAATSPHPEKRRISLLGWGIGALVSIGLWAAILYMIRSSL